MIALDARLAGALASVLVAGFMRGFAGFGAALAIVPALSVLYGPLDAVVTFSLLEIGAALQMLPAVARDARMRTALALVAAGMLTVPVGAWLLVTVDPELMRRVIGVLVLGFVGVLALGWRYRGTAPAPVALGVGALGGLLAGAASLGGPPVVLFLLSGPQTPRSVRANVTVYFVCTTLWGLVQYAWYGVVSARLVVFALVLAPVYAIGMVAGTRLFGRVSEAAFRRGALVLLALISLVALAR